MNKIILAIPTYNRASEVCSIFEMLNKQPDKNFTLIILNDGSNPDTRKGIKNRKVGFNFHYLESERPSGLPLARNKILDYIEKNNLYDENTYLAFLDDDLLIKNDFVEKIKFYSEKYDGFCFQMKQKGISTTFDFTKNAFLQKIFTPLIGKIIPFFGIVFGGFYAETKKIRSIDHLVGCCLIYNFSKNKYHRFDLKLNEGNYVMEDTCFSYGLKKFGNDLKFIGSYSFVHNSPPIGGCKMEDSGERFFWYWKHKLYLFREYHTKALFVSAIFFCFLEGILLSVFFKKNLIKKYVKAVKLLNY